MNVRSLLIAAAAVLVSSVALSAEIELNANAAADSGTYIAATLCSGGPTSFDCRVSPAYTQNVIARRKATVSLRKGAITVDEADSLLQRTDQVRGLLDRAVAVCGVDGRTGNCTKQPKDAERLLDQAKKQLAAIK